MCAQGGGRRRVAALSAHSTPQNLLGRRPELRTLRGISPRIGEPLVAFIFGSLCRGTTAPREAPLQRELAGHWAARRDDFRIIYRLDDEAKTMYVVKIARPPQRCLPPRIAGHLFVGLRTHAWPTQLSPICRGTRPTRRGESLACGRRGCARLARQPPSGRTASSPNTRCRTEAGATAHGPAPPTRCVTAGSAPEPRVLRRRHRPAGRRLLTIGAEGGRHSWRHGCGGRRRRALRHPHPPVVAAHPRPHVPVHRPCPVGEADGPRSAPAVPAPGHSRHRGCRRRRSEQPLVSGAKRSATKPITAAAIRQNAGNRLHPVCTITVSTNIGAVPPNSATPALSAIANPA